MCVCGGGGGVREKGMGGEKWGKGERKIRGYRERVKEREGGYRERRTIG